MSTLNEQEINAAIMQYRNRCPDSYPNATATELICSVLWSAGLFGRMAAKRNQEKKEILDQLESVLDGGDGADAILLLERFGR